MSDPIEAGELEPGLAIRLDQLKFLDFGNCFVKARAGIEEVDPEDRFHSFILIEFVAEKQMWLCAPLFSRRRPGSEGIDESLKTGSFAGWFAKSYISPYQQWMLSEQAIVGSADDWTKKEDRTYYSRGNNEELNRIAAMKDRNDADWRELQAVAPTKPTEED